ncbi:NUDIX domain-containing protein [Gorillibacterium sp. CAU 1737]|uniref:NUDIX hydrolase n=1 Tax=Gorillibacterium sp. CAU 1737 TaxID=3140362 RepID=UPI003260A3F1
MEVRFYEREEVSDDRVKFAVIVAFEEEHGIFVRHNNRSTWEIPGGRREPFESIEETAERELYEETGAVSYSIRPVCLYSVKRDENDESFGALFYATIQERGPIPAESEIGECIRSKSLPDALTYPEIQPFLHKKVTQHLGI